MASPPETTAAAYPHLGAFESTNIHGTGVDLLRTTRHLDLWRHDLEMMCEAGLFDFRYPIPWHRIETKPGIWDWSWIDGPMHLMRKLGLRPIADPLHHVSFPDWLEDGFAHPDFPALYCRFVGKVAERYEWVERYTVFNEPLPTLALCALMGVWYPRHNSEPQFVRMAANVAKAISLASRRLKSFSPSVQLIHVDSCEHHRPLDRQSELWVHRLNQRRFLFHDFAFGLVTKDHPLVPYLCQNGLAEEERQWIEDHPAPFDVLGLDYYHHSEIDWGWDHHASQSTLRFPCEQARGFRSVATDYVERFGIPVLLTETNIGGTVADRITWLKLMEEQAEMLAAEADFRGFCWFPSLDATDWNSLCTRADHVLSPMGIWTLDDSCRRISTELSGWYTKLANGSARSGQLPAYRFTPPLDRDLRGHMHLMQHWSNWQESSEL